MNLMTMIPVIAVDISGRHRTSDGLYKMVCAAVAVRITPGGLSEVSGMSTELFIEDHPPNVRDVAAMIEKTVLGLKKEASEGTIIVERGDLFNMDERECRVLFTRDIRFQSSIGERRAIGIAHHLSLSSRNLLIKCTDDFERTA